MEANLHARRASLEELRARDDCGFEMLSEAIGKVLFINDGTAEIIEEHRTGWLFPCRLAKALTKTT